jgi:hypothetical protein
MRLSEEQGAQNPMLPKTLRFCKVCEIETPHEVRTGAGVVARICVPCLERARLYDLDRD